MLRRPLLCNKCLFIISFGSAHYSTTVLQMGYFLGPFLTPFSPPRCQYWKCGWIQDHPPYWTAAVLSNALLRPDFQGLYPG